MGARVVGVIGAGLMGSGLARLFTGAGWTVAIHDRDPAAAARLAETSPDVRIAADLADLADGAELVIEAAAEIPAVKQALFEALAAVAARTTWLATNSSVIPVGVVAARVGDADAGRVLGTHFWNPPDIIPLVEVIEGPRTRPEAVAAVMAIMAEVGKEPVHVRRDAVPGNRMQHALWREAIALVEEGICSPADVDLIVKRSFGLRLPVLGPLENADLIGLDLTNQMHGVVYPTLSNAAGPVPALADRVRDGDLGVKTGRGFYDWSPQQIARMRRRLTDHLTRLLGPGGA